MHRRDLLVAIGLVAAGSKSVATQSMRSMHPHRFQHPIGNWDGPVQFRFVSRHDHGRDQQLVAVSFFGLYHGKEHSETVAMPPDYTLQDMVDATLELQQLANDTLNYLIQGQA